jgi:23S rRNA pseudouridine955/2504/2580 synthase
MKGLGKTPGTVEEVGAEAEEQRIDNFLLRRLKGVPKSHVYQVLRTGQVRVNSRRVGPDYRLKPGDRVRLPPMRRAEQAPRTGLAGGPDLWARTVFEDDALAVIDKPAGVASHGGSGVACGLIEGLRARRPQLRYLELVHRLDKETSGLIVVAKRRSALTALHAQLRAGAVEKSYLALVRGAWRDRDEAVSLPLLKHLNRAGERHVRVHRDGKAAETHFAAEARYPGLTLVRARLLTGRTHQIRVHLAHLGHPIAGDEKYGDFDWNRDLARQGLKRMFLHAERLAFVHPRSGERVALSAPLPDELTRFLASRAGAPRAGP